MMRVAEDYGRFFMVGKMFGLCILGSKGSFWLVHEEIERNVGFDVG